MQTELRLKILGRGEGFRPSNSEAYEEIRNVSTKEPQINKHPSGFKINAKNITRTDSNGFFYSICLQGFQSSSTKEI